MSLCQHSFYLLQRDSYMGRIYTINSGWVTRQSLLKHGFKVNHSVLCLRLGSKFRKTACPFGGGCGDFPELYSRPPQTCWKSHGSYGGCWVTAVGWVLIHCQLRSTVVLWPAQRVATRDHRQQAISGREGRVEIWGSCMSSDR